MRSCVILAALAGCYDPTVAPGAPCTTADDCPRALTCVANVCAGTGGADASTPDGVTVATYMLGDDADEIRDTEIWESNPGDNYGGDNHGSVDDGETTLVWFDVSQLPRDRIVVSATLVIVVADEADEAGGTVAVHRMRETWDESQATWLAARTGKAWSAIGARPPARDPTPFATFSPIAVGGAHVMTVPAALVQDWVWEPSSNAGIAFVRATSDEHVHLRTREANAGGPLLVVQVTR